MSAAWRCCICCFCCTGPPAADEVDVDAMSTDEAEVHEEVAEAVQMVRKARLRDDLLGMVCPVDWTIQAPEPLGDPNTPLPLQCASVSCAFIDYMHVHHSLLAEGLRFRV